MDIQYVYALDKKYIGRAKDPWKRYDQHVRGNVKSTRDWIAGHKKLPKLVILARYDHDITWVDNKDRNCRYEQSCVTVAEKVGWSLLYADHGWPPSREICAKRSKIAAQWRVNNPKIAHQIAVESGRVGARIAHKEKLPNGKSKNAVKGGRALIQWIKSNPEKARQNQIKRARAGGKAGGRTGGKIGGKVTYAKKLSNGKCKVAVCRAHIRWHVNRNITNLNCPFCVGTA